MNKNLKFKPFRGFWYAYYQGNHFSYWLWTVDPNDEKSCSFYAPIDLYRIDEAYEYFKKVINRTHNECRREKKD